MNTLQTEQDQLNAVKDFDLDSWLDDIQPPHRQQTVNTRGDLLARFSELKKLREDELRGLAALADALPEEAEADPGETIGADPFAEQRAEYDDARARIQAFADEMKQIERNYAANRATFTFKALDPEKRAEIAAEHADPLSEGGIKLSDQTVRLFLASVTSITILRDGVEEDGAPSFWTPERLLKFLAKIGEGQAALLWEAYIGLGVQDVTPPFSPASSPGEATSTF